MQTQTARRIKIAIGFLFAITALPLAGCGNHDQAGTNSGTMTPAQVQQNAQKENHTPPAASVPPASH